MTTSIWQKIALVFLGLILSLVLLEVGLRLGGFVLLSIQEYGNLRSIKQKGAYRILCIGESTTYKQYPHLLEQVLNQRNIGVRFSVIDKGVPGKNTATILSRVGPYLEAYHPNMVVAMMGINDLGIKYYQDIPESGTWLFRHCRVYRFGRILYVRLLKKLQKKDLDGFLRAGSDEKAKPDDTGTVSEKEIPSSGVSANEFLNPGFAGNASDRESKNPYLDRGNLFMAEKSAVFTAENDHNAYGGWEARNRKQDASFQYVELGRLFQRHGRIRMAEIFFKKALEIDPENDDASYGLDRLSQYQKKTVESKNLFDEPDLENDLIEGLFKKAFELNPRNAPALFELGSLYRKQGKFSQATDLDIKAIGLNPRKDLAFCELGWFYREQGKLSQAEDVLREAIERYPKNGHVLGVVASLYEEMGKQKLAQEYAKKANRFGLGNATAVTVKNYRKLKEILDGKGIKLVCVQYPMRNAELLKRIFENDKSVIFVDNESIFKEAVKKDGYKEYFRDMFGGDFGHCTPKGNMLLARNIADVILKKVFHIYA